ncbi:DUF4397 domain-containing protein [Pseudobacter ginsenosidimutans]|uniref:DUF4397 domain-containing protein n=1 Tax=Pseudobacter ginsenosidimutans TaxID=661488 RepID=A0A4Q7MZ05_9BACT|nr:DUF4397 domain-containing protein [Pseudobacter ginsenosidimutans]QEC43130.1 DUF4397 domain-containing protein [Pseudobacter ginsenosidimutans]RZS74487.1 hypothetical protein EV199_0335 [Pseudobacter ginsenosidimutans]
MKKINHGCFLFLFLIAACKKDNPRGTATLLMFNAVTGSDTLVTSFNGTETIRYFKTANRLVYGEVISPYFFNMNGQFNSYAGDQPIVLYNNNDTTSKSQPVFDLQVNLPVSSISSLFLTGSLADPDTLFTRDHLPYHPSTDSSMGIRFVNLSPGNMKLSVNLAGETHGSEVSGLQYKGITGFTNYPVTEGVEEYNYEFRDASNGDLITTFTIDVRNSQSGNFIINQRRYRNYTLMFYGKAGSTGTDKQAVQIMNNN